MRKFHFVHFTTNNREAADALLSLLRGAGWDVAFIVQTGSEVETETIDPFFNAVLQKTSNPKEPHADTTEAAG